MWSRDRRPCPVSSRIRSASVDLPWSMWAMIEKLRMRSIGRAEDTAATPRSRSARPVERLPVAQQRHRVARLALVPAAVADLEVQVVAPAGAGAADPAEQLAGVHRSRRLRPWPARSCACRRRCGRACGRRGRRSCPARRRCRSRRPPRRSRATSGVPGEANMSWPAWTWPERDGAEGVLGGAVVDWPDDRQERARGLAALVAVRAGRPVGDPLERAPGLVVNRDVRGGGLSGLGGGRRSGHREGRGEDGADGAGSVFRSAAAHVRFPFGLSARVDAAAPAPGPLGTVREAGYGTALGAWVSAPAPAFSRSISGRASGSTP